MRPRTVQGPNHRRDSSSRGHHMSGPNRSPETLPALWRRLLTCVACGAQRFLRLLNSRRSGSEALTLNDEAEVFPWMEHAVAVGAVLGTALAYAFSVAVQLGITGRIVIGLLGTITGFVTGLCLALTWANEGPSHSSNAAACPLDRWAPWLDDNTSHHVESDAPPIEEVEFLAATDDAEVTEDIVPERAPVRPRVFSPESGESLPLEHEIGSLLTGNET